MHRSGRFLVSDELHVQAIGVGLESSRKKDDNSAMAINEKIAEVAQHFGLEAHQLCEAAEAKRQDIWRRREEALDASLTPAQRAALMEVRAIDKIVNEKILKSLLAKVL